jgi:hypothetical protein
MDQELFQLELRDLKTWQRKCRRLNRVVDLMSDAEIVARATLLASPDGIEQHYSQLREEGRRNTRPGFLTVASNQTEDQARRQRFEKLFRRL